MVPRFHEDMSGLSGQAG